MHSFKQVTQMIMNNGFTIRDCELKNEAQPKVCDVRVDATGFGSGFVVVDTASRPRG
jgi:hypothetical protein